MTTEYKWEPWLEKGAQCRSYEPRMSVNIRGNIRINGAAIKALGNPEYVRILIDKRRQAIGLLATDANDEYGYRLRNEGKGPGRSVGARVPLVANKLLPVQLRRGRAEISGNILSFRLNGRR